MSEDDAGSAAAIGVDLGGTKVYAAAVDTGGAILREVRVDQHGTTGDASADLVAGIVRDLAHSPEVRARRLLGIAVGVPGAVDHAKGVVTLAVSLGWRNYPLRSWLQPRFDVPVLVENDVNLAAVGEYRFGAGRSTGRSASRGAGGGVRNMVLMMLGTGLGAGLIVDGALCRGETGAAGEIGYIPPDRTALGRRYDRYGPMENLISGTGIAERGARAYGGPTIDGQPLTARHVFRAARAGEPWATGVIDETADYLALTIATLAAILDPGVVVLGGGVADQVDLLLPRVQSQLAGLVQQMPRIEVSQLGTRAAILGALSLTAPLSAAA